ncbi:uncharacterized protein [Leuresthes tenuis]|uniref:uncharacterized protein n=1 Tax=Leuresthes tenuis TaxID=355514 RepID=UPI003B5028CB
MESCSFQSQLLSVMEVLAQAAVAEINRRVEDSCAVLRLEVSQSRRDIDLLKSKCEVLEAELRRSRMRARRKVCYTPADETFSTSVKEVFNDSLSTDWDRQMEAETSNQTPKSADMEPANEAELIQIKEEMEEEEMWRNGSKDKQISGAEQLPYFAASQPAPTDSFLERLSSDENPVIPEPLVTPADRYNTFPEQQLSRIQNEPELRVKHEMEEESDTRAAPPGSVHTLVTEEAEAELWSTSLCRDAGDPSVSYAGRQTEQIPSEFASQTSFHLEDMVPRTHSVGKSHSVLLSAARVKKRARTFACKRLQPEEGHNAFSQIGPMGSISVPQQSGHQYGAGAPHVRNPDGGSSSFVLARRMRTPWRSGLGEKRFSCTYCDKSFTRFSQLKEHLRSHTGEKPFSCLQCGRSFTKQCNLIRHAVVHSGEKPYECSQCGKCFTQRSSLKSHQKTVH